MNDESLNQMNVKSKPHRSAGARIMGRILLASVTTMLSNFGFAQQARTEKFGAWDLHCQTSQNSPSEECGLSQSVRSEDKPNVNIAVMIIKPFKAKSAILRIVAPPAVFLVNGVSMKIDQTDIGRLPFFRCAPGGCISDAPLDAELLSKLKNGKIATLVIYMEPDEGLRHQIRLDGFKEAFAQLR